LVAKDYWQRLGFNNRDALPCHMLGGHQHMLLAIAITNHFSIEQMNVQKTYLNGILRETVYASAQRLHRRHRPGMQINRNPTRTRAVLAQPRTSSSTERARNILRLRSDPCMYIRACNGEVVLRLCRVILILQVTWRRCSDPRG